MSDADQDFDPKVHAMLERLGQSIELVDRVTPPGPYKLPNVDRFVVAVHRRVRRMARAVALLLDNGFEHEAAIVARSLFEDSLRLGALAAAGEKRTGLIFSWIFESMTQGERVLRNGERSGEFDPAEREAIMTARRARLNAMAAKMGVTGRWPKFGNEEQMSRAQARDGEFHLYLIATQITHGSETGYFLDADPVGDGDRPGTPSARSEGAVGVTVGLAVLALLRAHMAAARIADWPGSDECQAILDMPLP